MNPLESDRRGRILDARPAAPERRQGICSVTFQVGERWLVYALGSPGPSRSLSPGAS